jgi:MerR family transcriptional regulator/heat shock protein HspR
MRQKMQQMETQVNELLEYVRREFFAGRDAEFEARKRGLVKVSQAKIVKLENREE